MNAFYRSLFAYIGSFTVPLNVSLYSGIYDNILYFPKRYWQFIKRYWSGCFPEKCIHGPFSVIFYLNNFLHFLFCKEHPNYSVSKHCSNAAVFVVVVLKTQEKRVCCVCLRNLTVPAVCASCWFRSPSGFGHWP